MSHHPGTESKKPTGSFMRPCQLYYEEYKDCKSLRGKFHQYFTQGYMNDCTQWKKDYENCMEYRKFRSTTALDDVMQHESERREARLKNSQANDVWEYRSCPPEDFYKPLPDYLSRMQLPTISDNSNKSSCTIS